MNANELAKLLEVDSWYKLVTREEIADTLRQQQAEIEALKAKTLTDEEIIEVWGVKSIWDDKLIDFARAILKKTSEK
jgi:hypothetical protein